ncbi:MAG: VWA domain-containing protein [Deltaproteobacteria bacterium]|nr:VWA domain-containing protein [Deltaproteobacteria bacterium]
MWAPGDIEWTHPWYLLAALAAIPVVLMLRRSPGRVVFSSLAALPHGGGSWRTALAWLPDALIASAVCALAVGMAGPRAGEKDSEVHAEGIAIMMVVDTSGSMQALDLSPPGREETRLDAIKRVFRTFVLGGGGTRGRTDDAIGLVSFARYADTRAPLTLDHGNLLAALDALSITRERNEDGTAIGDGLALAVERLGQTPARSRVAILLTDGVNNAGVEAPAGAAEWAKQQGIKVYAIGAGTNGMAPVRIGAEVVAQPVEIDEELLTKMAVTTGGRYFRATDDESLREIVKEIDQLERTQLAEVKFLEYNEYYGWCVAIGLGLAALAMIMRGTILRRLP